MSVRNQVPQSRLARFTATAAVFAAIVALGGAAVQADIVAEFTDGNGTSSPDQYEGTAGDGWLTPWRAGERGFGGLTWNNSVVSTNPLAGAGNYLSAQAIPDRNFFADGLVQRQYGEGGSTGVEYASEHTISWRFRVDDGADFHADLPGFRDGVAFHDRFSLSPVGGNPRTWWIGTFDEFDSGTPQWAYADFFQFNGWVVTATNVNFVVGDVYEFNVHLDDLAEGTWDGTITNLDWDSADGGNATFSWSDANSGGFGELATIGGFTMDVALGDLFGSSSGTPVVFSLDSLRITGQAAVPEAPALLIWSALAMTALVAQWWQTRRSRSCKSAVT
jgi:hypothetical protein